MKNYKKKGSVPSGPHPNIRDLKEPLSSQIQFSLRLTFWSGNFTRTFPFILLLRPACEPADLNLLSAKLTKKCCKTSKYLIRTLQIVCGKRCEIHRLALKVWRKKWRQGHFGCIYGLVQRWEFIKEKKGRS